MFYYVIVYRLLFLCVYFFFVSKDRSVPMTTLHLIQMKVTNILDFQLDIRARSLPAF